MPLSPTTTTRPRHCPECGGPLYNPGERRSRGPIREFCSGKCGEAFNERRKQRGAMLYDLVMGSDYEPGDPQRPEIRTAINRLKRAWRKDDSKSRANRKSWGDWREHLGLYQRPPKPVPAREELTAEELEARREEIRARRREEAALREEAAARANEERSRMEGPTGVMPSPVTPLPGPRVDGEALIARRQLAVRTSRLVVVEKRKRLRPPPKRED
jgi:predicted nucleic acid-binding Zn ribbon protein